MWLCEPEEADFGPDMWRVFDENDPSYEATICEVWGTSTDAEETAKLICDLYNQREIRSETVPMPDNEQQAVAMCLVSMEWLRQHAPWRLEPRSPDRDSLTPPTQ